MAYGRSCTAALLAILLPAGLVAGASLSPAAVFSAQAPNGLDVFRMNCDGCHDLPDPDRPRRTRAEWQAVLNKMVNEKGASLNQQEFTAVLNYLAGFGEQRRQPIWNDRPAVSHRFEVEAGQLGRLPDPWVNLTLGSQVDTPWTVQREPGGKSLFLATRQGVPEGQQQLLLDNSGVLTVGTISTRLRIASGKGSTGAGLVFGFRNSHSFFGARLSPVSRDLVFYDVDQGERALLGRSAVVTAPDQWISFALTLTASQVQATVNGKPLLSRPLAGYRGGRVGLAADGATIAWFDQWAVTAGGEAGRSR